MKYKLWLVWMWVCNQWGSLWAWFEKDMPKPGGALLPSLTDMQFLRREGYVECLKDITTYTQSIGTQLDQLVLVRLIEYLNRKGSHGTK